MWRVNNKRNNYKSMWRNNIINGRDEYILAIYASFIYGYAFSTWQSPSLNGGNPVILSKSLVVIRLTLAFSHPWDISITPGFIMLVTWSLIMCSLFNNTNINMSYAHFFFLLIKTNHDVIINQNKIYFRGTN